VGLVLLLVLAPACGCDGPGDVVLVTVDTLRADHLSIYGYPRTTSPNLDRLFAQGAIFERAYSTSAYTSASTASLLSGLLPQEHRVRLLDQIFPEQVKLLSELLPDEYQTAAFVSTHILSDAATGIADRFEHFDDAISRRGGDGRRERIAGPTTDAVLAWLRDGRDPARPLFLWVHYMDPHGPYNPPEDFSGRFHHEAEGELDLGRIPPYARLEHADDPLDYVDRYDEEVLYADAEIGRLLEGYAALASLDDALVILTADHGETLLERRMWFTHAYQVFEEVVSVPLLLRGPGVPRGRQRALVSGIDVVPTILGFVGAPAPPGLAGADLRRPASLAEDRTVYVESANRFRKQVRAAIQGDRKWSVTVERENGRVAAQHTFDLAADPGERTPRRWRNDPVGRRLLELVETDPDPAGWPAHPQQGRLKTQNKQLLRALGYVE
jgi:arylsulfatase A-like enzyme